MKLNDIDLIQLTNIYIQQNNLAQGITEIEFVDKYFEIYKNISEQFKNTKKLERKTNPQKYSY